MRFSFNQISQSAYAKNLNFYIKKSIKKILSNVVMTSIFYRKIHGFSFVMFFDQIC